MVEDTFALLTIGQLRLKYAINLFKHLLLGDQHESGKAQAESVLDKLGKKEEDLPWSGRTWQSWFSKTPSIPKLGKIQSLDQMAELFHLHDENSLENGVSGNFFSSMVHGGLLQSMLLPTKSKHTWNTLLERANSYEPISPIHLHLDAVEVSAWTQDFKGIPWSKVTSVAAGRIMGILVERWSPRHGKLYRQFSSDIRLQCDAASPEERNGILESYSKILRVKPEKLLKPGAKPNWERLGCTDDIAPTQIYKLLFAMPADSSFLVQDRFDAWFLDLGTAALALHALGWTDRYNIMGELTEEKMYWNGLDEIFFDEAPLEEDGWGISAAANHCQAEWQPDSFDLFCKAREKYRELIKDGGISVQEIMSVAMAAKRKYPIIYRS